MTRLSKSRIMSSLQCSKKLWLEVNQRDLAQYSASTLAAFETGHLVGEKAQEIYGGHAGTEIPYKGGSFAPAIRQTHKLMGGLIKAPVYEATLEHEGVLVREDISLPQGDSWRVVEIKASTRVKPEHVQDCAIQAWVHLGAGYSLESISLGHVDNQFIYTGNGDYVGLIVEQDLTEQVMDLQPSVPVWVENAKAAAEGVIPDVDVGGQCTKPYDCPFMHYCWPSDSSHPVTGLGGGREKLGRFVKNEWMRIVDVPLNELSDTQLRIAHATRKGEPEIQPGAGEWVRALPYPRYYLDFETVGPAIPRWEGTRPYETLPFQYSIHIESESGEIGHREFLDMSGDAPMRALAERMIEDLGASGPVLMYTNYEERVIKGLAGRFPDLAVSLRAILERLEDMLPPVKANYYHPDMLGSWSIKAVLPTVAPDLDYEGLEGIKEGTQASTDFLEAIRPETDAAERDRIEQELLTYCRHDTLAMVRLAQFFASH